MGDAKAGRVRLSFNPQLRVEFRRATVTSDAGLLLPRELDEQLGLSTLVLDGVFSEARPGRSPFTPRPHRATTTWRTSSPPSAPVSERLLARRHLEPADDTAPADPPADVSPVLA
jgi:hypothetical protein